MRAPLVVLALFLAGCGIVRGPDALTLTGSGGDLEQAKPHAGAAVSFTWGLTPQPVRIVK